MTAEDPSSVPSTVRGPEDVDELPVRSKVPLIFSPPAFSIVEMFAVVDNSTGRFAVPAGMQTCEDGEGTTSALQFPAVDHDEEELPVQVSVQTPGAW